MANQKRNVIFLLLLFNGRPKNSCCHRRKQHAFRHKEEKSVKMSEKIYLCMFFRRGGQANESNKKDFFLHFFAAVICRLCKGGKEKDLPTSGQLRI